MIVAKVGVINMILKEEPRFRDADVERSKRINEAPSRRVHLYIHCDDCGKEWWAIKQSFIVSKSYSLNNLTKKDYCRSCRWKQDKVEGIRISKRQELSPTVGTTLKKGISIKHSQEYLLAWTSDLNHPRLQKRKKSLKTFTGGRVYEHILIMEKYLDRYLKLEEKVHHLDGNKQNNQVENLHLCRNIAHHSQIHDKMEKFVNLLIRQGLVVFNKEKEEYVLVDNAEN